MVEHVYSAICICTFSKESRSHKCVWQSLHTAACWEHAKSVGKQRSAGNVRAQWQEVVPAAIGKDPKLKKLCCSLNKPQQHQQRLQLAALQAEQATLPLQQRTLFTSRYKRILMKSCPDASGLHVCFSRVSPLQQHSCCDAFNFQCVQHAVLIRAFSQMMMTASGSCESCCQNTAKRLKHQ